MTQPTAPPRAAFLLDGRGGATPLPEPWPQEAGEGGTLWFHLDATSEETRSWIRDDSGLDEAIADALLAGDTRPRFQASANGMLLILRSANLQPGAEPADLVSLRIWAEPGRVISLRRRPTKILDGLRPTFEGGEGPTNSGELAEALARGAVDRLEDVVFDLEEEVDDFEEKLEDTDPGEANTQLTGLRRRVIALRRFLFPQRDAFLKLAQTSPAWLEVGAQDSLHHLADQVVRLAEDIDALRDRSTVANDQLESRMNLRMNQRLYLFTVVATVFLPLGILTGLLGINVGGMPGAEDPNAFWMVAAGLTALGGIELAILRSIRWL
ncbi:MAG: zinc transporter ZntB [Planctomycetes bacterium]|nr:zinc transporter ZntB [Planctomycetota bacterium]